MSDRPKRAPLHPDNVEMSFDWAEMDGFQFDGRSRAIAEWRQRKDDDEFQRLCARLYKRNWAREERRRDPEKVRQRQRDWRNANRERVRRNENERRARKRAQRPPRVCQNPRCRKEFMPQHYYNTAKWCSKKCGNNYHSVIRSRAKNRGIRNMDLEPTVIRILRQGPWLTLGEIAERAEGAKRGSIATKLTQWAKEGKLVHDGKKKWRRYALRPLQGINSTDAEAT